MIDQIDINDFFQKCGPTSTPIVKNQRISRSRLCNRSNYVTEHLTKDTIPRLLESKEVWPIAFSTVCQDFLNNLHLDIGRDFLLQQPERDRSRRLSPMILRRSRSRTRDRSMSPSGARKMKESKWDKNMDIAMLLMDEVLKNYEELPEMFLMHRQYKIQSKELLETLSKNISLQQKKQKIKENNLIIIGQCLHIVLEKIGVIVPETISQQMELLKSLTYKTGEKLVKRKNHIEAMQTLMVNISKKSRILLQKIINVLQILSKLAHVNLSVQQLATVLRPCLFDENNDNNLKLCGDIITLSDRIFDAPVELLKALREKINTRPDDYNPFDEKPNKPMVIRAPISVAHTQSRVTTFAVPHFFTHSKHLDNIEPVILTSVKKLSSPEQTNNNQKHQSFLSLTHKRKSFTEITKKIFEKSISPFKKTKDYNLTDFYLTKKPRTMSN